MSRTVDVQAELNEGLRELRLPAVRQSYEELARQAEREQLTYERYLLELVQREEDARQEARTTRLLRQSRIPREKNLGTFDLKRLPVKAARQIKTLLEGDFLDRHENLLVFGHPGSGKTHALCAIGLALIAQGRKLYFTTSALLVQDLLRAKLELKLSRFIKQLSYYEGLIIDELGYGQQSREEMEVLFTLLAHQPTNSEVTSPSPPMYSRHRSASSSLWTARSGCPLDAGAGGAASGHPSSQWPSSADSAPLYRSRFRPRDGFPG